MATKRTIQIVIRRGEPKYVAECLDFPIGTEAGSLDELVGKIEESVSLFLKDEDLAQLGLAEHPIVPATLELEGAGNGMTVAALPRQASLPLHRT